MARKASSKPADSTANLGFEAKLWLAADKLRNNMDAAEPSAARQTVRSTARRVSAANQYKHVVLGLIFLSRAERDRSRVSVTRRASRDLRVKYISDSFEEHHAKLKAGKGDYAGANPEDPDEYRAENIFWVPPAARWSYLQASAKQPTIGKIVDDAMVAIERDNPRLKGVLPKDYARPALDKHRLGELIDLIGTISLVQSSHGLQPVNAAADGLKPGTTLGSASHRSVDLLGRVYEYFLTQFASAEGKNGGQFYTPSCVVRLLVEMLAPYNGRIYDPACGSGGGLPAFRRLRRMRFAAQDRAIAPGGVQSQGQNKWAPQQQPKQSNATTRRLAICGIEADFGPEHADTFRRTWSLSSFPN